jgi:hypothetical protein
MRQIAMLIRCQESVLSKAVEILADQRVKWIICHSSATNLPPICHPPATSIPKNSGKSSIVQGEGEGEGEGEGQGEGAKALVSDETDGKTLPHGNNFKSSWSEWIQYLGQKRKKPTKLTIEKQLKTLYELSETDAVMCINNSIMNGWQGLFPDKMPTSKPKQPTNGIVTTNADGKTKIGGREYSIITGADIPDDQPEIPLPF